MITVKLELVPTSEWLARGKVAQRDAAPISSDDASPCLALPDLAMISSSACLARVAYAATTSGMAHVEMRDFNGRNDGRMPAWACQPGGTKLWSDRSLRHGRIARANSGVQGKKAISICRSRQAAASPGVVLARELDEQLGPCASCPDRGHMRLEHGQVAELERQGIFRSIRFLALDTRSVWPIGARCGSEAEDIAPDLAALRLRPRGTPFPEPGLSRACAGGGRTLTWPRIVSGSSSRLAPPPRPGA